MQTYNPLQVWWQLCSREITLSRADQILKAFIITWSHNLACASICQFGPTARVIWIWWLRFPPTTKMRFEGMWNVLRTSNNRFPCTQKYHFDLPAQTQLYLNLKILLHDHWSLIHLKSLKSDRYQIFQSEYQHHYSVFQRYVLVD